MTSGSGHRIVLDTMCLMHYALADRLDVLGELLVGSQCFSTVVVRGELHDKSTSRPQIATALQLPWLDFAPLDSIDDLRRFANWHGLEVHGNFWLLARAVRDGKTTLAGSCAIIDMLRDSGLRLPCSGVGFESCAKGDNLIQRPRHALRLRRRRSMRASSKPTARAAARVRGSARISALLRPAGADQCSIGLVAVASVTKVTA
jgi:hypothetical protein